MTRRVVLDTETTGLSIFKGAEPFLIGTKELNSTNSWLEYNIAKTKELLEDESIEKIAHNMKFDALMLRTKDIEVKGKFWDTMLMLHLLEAHESSSLLNGTRRWAPEHLKQVDKIEEWFVDNGVKKDDRRYDQIPKWVLEPYLCGDLDSTEALFNVLMPIIEDRGLLPLLEQECALIKVLIDMYINGIKIDIDYLMNLADKYIVDIEALQKVIYQTAGCEFDILSARQLAKILIKAGANLVLTDKGNYSCSEDNLKKVDHPLVDLILEFRHKSKFLSTYIAGMLREQTDDIIHCDLLQHGTVTGRFSSREPNMQNIPRDDKDIRKAFIARSADYNLFFIDYKQMEYRVFLDYINESRLIAQINNEGADFHTLVAEMLRPYIKYELVSIVRRDAELDINFLFNGAKRSYLSSDLELSDEDLALNAFKKHCRNTLAKTFNFAMIYGAGINKIAEMLSVSYDTAKMLKEVYFKELPNVRPFFVEVERNIRLRTIKSPYPGKGFVRNKYGRQYWLSPSEAYKATNYIIQGTCADMVKQKMIEVHELLNPYKSNLLLQIHDELILEIHKDERFLLPKIKEVMEDFGDMFKVKIGVDVSWSKNNWANKEDYTIE